MRPSAPVEYQMRAVDLQVTALGWAWLPAPVQSEVTVLVEVRPSAPVDPQVTAPVVAWPLAPVDLVDLWIDLADLDLDLQIDLADLERPPVVMQKAAVALRWARARRCPPCSASPTSPRPWRSSWTKGVPNLGSRCCRSGVSRRWPFFGVPFGARPLA